MADLQIRVTAMLDQNSSKTKIQSQLDEIAKGLKLTVGIDPKQLSEFNNQLKQIQQQFKQTSNTKIVTDQDVNKIKEVYTSIDKAVEKYSQLGTVKISQNLDPVTKELQSFQLQVTKANGEVDKLKFTLASLRGIQGVNGFVMTGQSSTNNTQAITERQLQQEQQINRTIEQRSQALANQLQLYQRTAEIQASALRNNPNKIISPEQDVALTNYLNNVRSLNVSTPQLQQRMRELGLDFREVSSQAQTAGRNSMTFGESLQTAMEKFPIWMVASTAFFQTFNFFKNGIEYVNELNQALTQISIVTYQNQQQVAALGESYNKLAQSMGVTTMDIANEATELYRQGLSADQVTERMKIITQYAKISSLDTKNASEIMTAAINSMGVSAQRASDVWSYLGKQNCPLAS